MNEYKITYSIGAKGSKHHYSNLIKVIKGETFEEAVKDFKEKMLDKGLVVFFVIKGDIFEEIYKSVTNE
ncbi:hypothetical protein FKN04_12945 [Bacillus glycinifermentans]|uniref:hypothetical protein n=1 Tax=Bacillus TaxID=1386 RepID=UPI001581DA6F|nr:MULTISPECIES: hypothetical protein [Bacillus]NUJ17483.1 hypothetical protein [Bacillus glycinifermentans]GIN67063.1 hypothetical protein J41TS2_24840 [Bacillus sonorensis]